MAIVEVKVPQLSESVAEATLLQWKKKPGDAVAIDEILIEVETDKVVLEVPAPAAGVLVAHVVPNGATVLADQLIAQIDPEKLEDFLPLELDALGGVMLKDETACIRCSMCATRCPTQAFTMRRFTFHRELEVAPEPNPRLRYTPSPAAVGA